MTRRTSPRCSKRAARWGSCRSWRSPRGRSASFLPPRSATHYPLGVNEHRGGHQPVRGGGADSGGVSKPNGQGIPHVWNTRHPTSNMRSDGARYRRPTDGRARTDHGTGAEGTFMASIFLQNVAGVLASLAVLELELGPERRTAARDARRARGQSIGRPKALTNEKAALWRGGCTTAESRPAPSQPRLTSAAPPSIAR